MNKKLSIFAIVLIIVGLIGSIWSGFFSMPYFINKIQTYDEQINKENIIYDKKVDINKLDINTNYASITVLKSNSDKVIVKTSGLNDSSQVKVNSNGKTLSIEEKHKNSRNIKIKGIDDLADKVIEEAFSSHRNMILIYVPNNVDLDITSDASILNIEDDIFLNDFNFKTTSGGLSLPNEIKKLKKMSISSQSNISLRLYELLGIDEVILNCSSVDIYSDNYNLDDVEKYIPKKLVINTDNLSEGNININSSFPVSKNIEIKGYKSDVVLNLPLDKYKFNFDLIAYDGIEVNDFMSNILFNVNRNDEDLDNSHNELKEIKRIINEDEKDEYIINILASDIYFE